jgi:hypothetical protein
VTTLGLLGGAAWLLVVQALVVTGCLAANDDPPRPDGSAATSAVVAFGASALFRPPDRVQEIPGSGAERRAMRVLSNGCTYSPRGIPGCGALLGAAYGTNTPPDEWEQSMGHPLGVHRTYWAADDVAEAVETARLDLQHDRMPWISFKLPHSWEQMRDGAGDGWARDLAQRLSVLDGPVWLAFHHEPEGDGDIRAWTAMQAHLAPIVREAAPNVAYSLILTGWNQLQGDREFALDAIWPADTAIDLVGFDVYETYGVEQGDNLVGKRRDFGDDYFAKFRQFAQSHGVAWAIAETGHNDRSAEDDPQWVERVYRTLTEYGGVALTYFNTTVESATSWHLSGAKEQEFAAALRTTPTL